MPQDPAVWALAAFTLAVQLAYAGRYDIFRNELYYIVCGRHPAFGYADQPPLVPLIAAATQVFGIHAWLLRVPAALAGAALVPLTASLTRMLGGGGQSAIMAAIAAAIAPALIAMAQILTTSTFEPLAWTACAWFFARAAVSGHDRTARRALIWAGVTAGVALQAKYGIALWLAGIAIGLLLTGERRLLALREAWIGAALALAIAAPSLIWQTVEGWPFLAVMMHHTVTHSNFTGTPPQFEIGQALAMNIVLAPLWITGLVAPFVRRRLRPARFLAIAYAVAAAIDIAARGKDYYLFPAYPALFAIGAAACTKMPKLLSSSWLALAVAATAFVAPVVLPMLDPPALQAYLNTHHLHPAPDEAAAVGAPLTQVFSDELGWRDLEKSVAAVFHALPADEQKRAAIVASNYGEAAAIDVYGGPDGLPPALSGQDQYYIWGPRGYDGSVTIHINGNPERWRPNCASLEIAGSFGAPLVMPYENGRPIFVCRGLRVPLQQAWPMFRRFQ